MIVGGEWEWVSGDSGSSSSWGGFLVDFPRFAGPFRHEKKKRVTTDNKMAAAPPTTAVSKMVNIRSCEGDTRKTCSPPTMTPVVLVLTGVGFVKLDDMVGDGDKSKTFGFSVG